MMRMWLLGPAAGVLTILTGAAARLRQGRFVFGELDPGYGKAAIADLNRDGRNDVILRASGDEAFAWFEALAPGGFRKRFVLRSLPFSGHRIAAAGIDGDGDLDLVSRAWNGFPHLHAWRNDALAGGRSAAAPRISTVLERYGAGRPASLRQYRLPIEIRGGGFARIGEVVEIEINWVWLL